MRQNLSTSVVAIFLLSVVSSVPAGAAEQEERSETGYYAEEQASRGRTLYAEACAACHGRELMEGPASPLAGVGFIQRWTRSGVPSGPWSAFLGWSSGSVDDLFFIIRTTMPQGTPGSLSTDEYLDVVSYILNRNGYPSGKSPLTADPAVLSAISIEWKGAGDLSRAEAPDFIEGEQGLTPADGTYLPPEELKRAHENPRDWLYHTHDYTGRRYVDLDQINRTNAHRLQVGCVYQLGENSNFQTGPIVYRGAMYLTTVHLTVAIDAATCRTLWRHQWDPRHMEAWRNNRGVAISQGRVVRGTADGYLLALDASNGKLLWARRLADTSLGESFTMAPLIYEDLVLIGPAGSENAISGWVGAFRLEDGKEVWRFKTVPGAREPGDDTWGNPEDLVLGGGAVWTPFSLDPEREELYTERCLAMPIDGE